MDFDKKFRNKLSIVCTAMVTSFQNVTRKIDELHPLRG